MKSKVDTLRLFCMGKELKDDLFLYSYDIADEMVLQVMYKKAWWIIRNKAKIKIKYIFKTESQANACMNKDAVI